MLHRRLLIVTAGMLVLHAVEAAEWTTEPGLQLTAIHNDNVGMRSVDEVSSTGYTVAPHVNFAGREINWDVGMNALVKATRYNTVDNADSDNYFFDLGGGYSTERHTFRLDSSFSRNNTYDSDYNTELPDAGLTDSFTERETTTIAPSWQWRTSESSAFSLSLSSNDIEYDEVSNTSYRGYQLDSATIKSLWNISARSQLGFTLSYEEYENDKRLITILTTDFDEFQEYKQYIYQLDYVYNLAETSQLNISLGSRKMDSISHAYPLSCSLALPDFLGGECVVPVLGDFKRSNNGAVASINYSHSNEVSSISTSLSRIVVPSSYGGAQEQDTLSLLYDRELSERWRTSLILDARETTAIEGLDASADRTRYRMEPKIIWKLKKNWDLVFSYRYLKQNLTETDTDSKSNLILINLHMGWPRWASTY